MKLVCLLSGGMDSTTALYKALEEGHKVALCLAFDYGSKHNRKEHSKAREIAKDLGIRFEKIHLDFSLFESALLKSGGEVPEGHYADKSMKKTVVPFRNGIMLSFACGIAESLDCDAVLIGNHAGDHAIYPDCRTEFIESMQEAMRKGTYRKISIYSPFCNISKTEIAKIGNSLSVPWQNTWSCYKGKEAHCGKCGTCFERKEAFREAGLVDPTIYVEEE